MADKIYVNVEAAEEAIAMLEYVLEEWKQNGASVAESMYGVMERQQADSTVYLGYLLDDFAEKRSGEITKSVAEFTHAAKTFVEAFKQGDTDLQSMMRGER